MRIPEELIAQLNVGGRMVVPLGNAQGQELVLVTRTASEVTTEVLENVKFVPLVSGKA